MPRPLPAGAANYLAAFERELHDGVSMAELRAFHLWEMRQDAARLRAEREARRASTA